jgi:hypothetical protein
MPRVIALIFATVFSFFAWGAAITLPERITAPILSESDVKNFEKALKELDSAELEERQKAENEIFKMGAHYKGFNFFLADILKRPALTKEQIGRLESLKDRSLRPSISWEQLKLAMRLAAKEATHTQGARKALTEILATLTPLDRSKLANLASKLATWDRQIEQLSEDAEEESGMPDKERESALKKVAALTSQKKEVLAEMKVIAETAVRTAGYSINSNVIAKEKQSYEFRLIQSGRWLVHPINVAVPENDRLKPYQRLSLTPFIPNGYSLPDGLGNVEDFNYEVSPGVFYDPTKDEASVYELTKRLDEKGTTHGTGSADTFLAAENFLIGIYPEKISAITKTQLPTENERELRLK